MIHITNEDNMDLMARYPDNYFDLAIIDPPYGLGEDKIKRPSRGLSKIKEHKSKDWDKEPSTIEYFEQLFRVSKNQIIWGANHFIERINKNSSCWIVWNKKTVGNTADCELAWTSFNTAVRRFDFMWEGFWQEDMKNKEKRIHPTQKPIALYKWLLTKYAKEGDKILDTHLGSGSIAIACHDLGFNLTACEIDADYYNAAMKRLSDHQKQLKLL